MPEKIKDLINFAKIYPQEALIGIEIEMEGARLSFERSKYWKATFDGSLRPNPEAIEYVLKHPIEIETVPRILLGIETFLLKKRGAKFDPSDRCGIHIHFNVQHYTTTELMNFICTYLIVENLLLKYCDESREGNLFCLRAVDAEFLIDCLIEFQKYGNLRTLTRRNNLLRYAALNVESIYKHGSLEFRALQTPKRFIKIVEWVTLLNDIRVAALRFDSPQDIVEAFSFYGGVDFTRHIFRQNYATLIGKGGFDINQTIMQGIRLVQDIAYTKRETKKQSNFKIKVDNNQDVRFFINQLAEPIRYAQMRVPINWIDVPDQDVAADPPDEPPEPEEE